MDVENFNIFRISQSNYLDGANMADNIISKDGPDRPGINQPYGPRLSCKSWSQLDCAKDHAVWSSYFSAGLICCWGSSSAHKLLHYAHAQLCGWGTCWCSGWNHLPLRSGGRVWGLPCSTRVRGSNSVRNLTFLWRPVPFSPSLLAFKDSGGFWLCRVPGGGWTSLFCFQHHLHKKPFLAPDVFYLLGAVAPNPMTGMK